MGTILSWVLGVLTLGAGVFVGLWASKRFGGGAA